MKKTLCLLLTAAAVLTAGCGLPGEAATSSQVLEFEAQSWTLAFSGTEQSVEGQAAQ